MVKIVHIVITFLAILTCILYIYLYLFVLFVCISTLVFPYVSPFPTKIKGLSLIVAPLCGLYLLQRDVWTPTTESTLSTTTPRRRSGKTPEHKGELNQEET